MTRLPERLGDADAQRAKPADMPEWVEPMRATLIDVPFSDPDWLFERKLDGVRCLAYCGRGGVDLYTRNRKPRNDHFPELVEALDAAVQCHCVLDGEVVAFTGNVTSFARLQARIGVDDPRSARDSGVKIYFYVFDCPWADGYDLRGLALRARKRLLGDIVKFAVPLRYTRHRNEYGEALLEEACGKGWEGVIAKRADSPYARRRSRHWLKLRCDARQEFVIGGFTVPHGARRGFGALLLGYYEGGELRYAGRVGTGFDEAMLTHLRRRLDKRLRRTCPFADRVAEDGVHWVTPHLVGEVMFTEWTEDGKLRHPRFVGLREDKPAENVVRERPA